MGTDREHGLDRGPGRSAVHRGLLCFQACAPRADSRRGRRGREPRDHRERGLPRLRRYRDDGCLRREHRETDRAHGAGCPKDPRGLQPSGTVDDGRRGGRHGHLPLLGGGPRDHWPGDRHRRWRSPGMTDTGRLAGEATAIARKLASVAGAGAEGRVNRRLIRALAEEGVLPRLFPRRAGGTREGDVSAVDLCTVREALARESTPAENALAIQTLGAYPIVLAGSDEQAGRYAGPVARGEAVAAFALTEPGAGTDAGALALRAEPDGKGYRLTGTKVFISNAPDADSYTIFAKS